MVEDIGRRLEKLPSPPSVALFSDTATGRARLPLLADVVRARTKAACGCFMVDQTRLFLYVLPGLLAATGAVQFCVLGPNTVLDDAAWEAAFTALDDPSGELRILRFHHRDSLAGFIWTRAAFQAWLHQSPKLFGVRHGTGILAQGEALPGLVRSFVGEIEEDRLLEAIDQIVLGAEAQP